MPLKEGKSDDDIAENIKRLMDEGYEQKQAIAIAYSKAGRGRQKAAGEVKAMSKQVLVKTSNLHGSNNRMERADVISSSGDQIRVKLGHKILDLKQSQVTTLDGKGGTKSCLTNPRPEIAFQPDTFQGGN